MQVDDDRPEAAEAVGVNHRDVAPAARGDDSVSHMDKGTINPQSFAIGEVVKLHSLKARKDLNGREGVVEAPGDETVAAGRIRVKVAGECVGVKPENLERLQGTASPSVAAPGAKEGSIIFEKIDEDDLAPGNANQIKTSH